MYALVVFDSEFGNTRQIARAVAEGLEAYGTVEVAAVEQAPARPPADVVLVVAGGPTHVHGLSSARTRQVTPEQAAQGATPARVGLREWVTGLAPAADAPFAATFDTRLDKARWLTGSAAASAGKVLRRKGYRMVAPPESFLVSGTPGPLLPDEVDRAREWGRHLGAAVATADRVG